MDVLLFFVLFNIFEMIADFTIVLKIFALMAIVSFVRMHLGDSPLAIVIILGMGWFILFDYWKFFGGLYVLYMLLIFGASTILIDFFFVSGGHGGSPEEMISGHAPAASGGSHMQHSSRAHAAMAHRRMGR